VVLDAGQGTHQRSVEAFFDRCDLACRIDVHSSSSANILPITAHTSSLIDDIDDPRATHSAKQLYGRHGARERSDRARSCAPRAASRASDARLGFHEVGFAVRVQSLHDRASTRYATEGWGGERAVAETQFCPIVLTCFDFAQCGDLSTCSRGKCTRDTNSENVNIRRLLCWRSHQFRAKSVGHRAVANSAPGATNARG
jgi:hypothetical protein